MVAENLDLGTCTLVQSRLLQPSADRDPILESSGSNRKECEEW